MMFPSCTPVLTVLSPWALLDFSPPFSLSSLPHWQFLSSAGTEWQEVLLHQCSVVVISFWTVGSLLSAATLWAKSMGTCRRCYQWCRCVDQDMLENEASQQASVRLLWRYVATIQCVPGAGCFHRQGMKGVLCQKLTSALYPWAPYHNISE